MDALKVRFADFSGDEDRPRPLTDEDIRRFGSRVVLWMDVPTVLPWEVPANSSVPVGESAPRGSEKQTK